MSRPRLCLAQPGLNHTAQNAYALVLTPLARALSRHFELSLLFRSVLEPVGDDFPVLTVLPAPDVPAALRGSARDYFFGASLATRHAYLRRLEALAPQLQADFVLERQWRHVGRLAAAAERAGISAGLVSEGEFYETSHRSALRAPRAALRRWVDWAMASGSRSRGYRTASLLFPETEAQRLQIIRAYGPDVAAKSVVVPVGVDPVHFRPRDRVQARAALGLGADRLHLLYLGSLNGSIQNPDRLIEGLVRSERHDVMLHIVGDGDQKTQLEARARALQAPVVFHGFVPHEQAGLFIAAADLTLAPYRAELYQDGVFTSASCKIREYLASGRPVLTIPSGPTRELTGDGRYGVLIENETARYAAFFRNALTREHLREKEAALLGDLSQGLLRQRGLVQSWDDIADLYAAAIMRVLAR